MHICVLDKKEQKDMHMLDKKEQKHMHMFCICTCMHLLPPFQSIRLIFFRKVKLSKL
jgi:hypothetical protein